MNKLDTLITGLAFGESPRWHNRQALVVQLGGAGDRRGEPERCG